MLNKIYIIILFLFFVSCNDSKKNETTIESQNTLEVTDKKSVNSIGETLNSESKKIVEDWKEYEAIDNLLNEFYIISTDDALNKAKDLSTYAQQLKDSIRVKQFDRSDIKIRLNVLYNNTLRLADMQTISTIKTEEVKSEIANILNSFSAINSKINNINTQKNLEKELVDFQGN